MRVICGNCVREIKWAEHNGKQLVLKDFDNVCYYTDDYYHENIALCALNDLAVNGYIRVKTLHLNTYKF